MNAEITTYDRPSNKYEYKAIEFNLPDGWSVSKSSVNANGFGISRFDVEVDGNTVRVGIRKLKIGSAVK